MTSACGRCCPDTAVSAYLSPGTVAGIPGSINQFLANQVDEDCYMSPRTPYPVYSGVYYSSSETPIATIDSFGMATAVSSGTTTISATFNGEGYFNCAAEAPNEESCCDQFIVPLFDEAQYNVIPMVASISAEVLSTKNAASNVRPANTVFLTTNSNIAFATETNSSDLLVAFQSSMEQITINAVGVVPTTGATLLKWKIDRDTTDTVGTGVPALNTQVGGQLLLTPDKAGNFRLICYFDANTNNNYDTGEELKVLRLVIVRTSISSDDCTIDSPMVNFQGDFPNPTEFGVTSGIPMSINCEVLIEGGGSNKRIGVSKIHFANIGNLVANTAKVNYKLSGIATENPNGTLPVALPMVDTNQVTQGNSPTGGDTAKRGNSSETSSNASGGGQTKFITSDDIPGFGPYKLIHPTTNKVWATTLGGYDFREFIAGYSDTFPRNYVVVAKANWTVRYLGSRNKTGDWVDNGSTVTLQGMNQTSTTFTVTVTNGTPQSGDTSGIQVLGRSYVNEHLPVYAQ